MLAIIAGALLVERPFCDEIDIEFDKYRSNDSLNKYFYKNRVDSGFHKEFNEAETLERQSRIIPLLSPLYYLLPVETVFLYSPFYSNSSMIRGKTLIPLFAALAVIPPIGHCMRISASQRYRRLSDKHGIAGIDNSFAKGMYYVSTAIRWVLPLYILSESEYYGEGFEFPQQILLTYIPSMMQLYSLNKLDENISGTKQELDKLNLSPGIGLIPTEKGMAIFFGAQLGF